MYNLILNLWNNYKYKILFISIFIISLFVNMYSIKSCSNYRDLNNNNIIALTDSIHYYHSKTGELIASKRLLEGDLTTLKNANDSLYTVVKNMNIKDPTSVVYVSSTIDNSPVDTVWSIDTIIPNLNINKSFAFNNKYRSLEGIVNVNDTTLGINIQKDQTYVDYTLAIEDNTVKILSSNPYVKFNEIQGITIPKPKHANWGFTIGPGLFTGVDATGKFTMGIGVTATWGYRIK